MARPSSSLRKMAGIFGEKPKLNQLQCMEVVVDGKRRPFRLMDRLEPYMASVAIALGFPHYRIAIFKRSNSPVFDLLSEWLRGANMEEDRRPLTWETLITALQAAKLHEEATILENHLAVQSVGESTTAVDSTVQIIPTDSRPRDENRIVMMKAVNEENEQLRREVRRLKEEKEKRRKEQQNAVTHYDHPPRDNPPQITGMLQPRSHDPTYPQSNIIQPLPTPGAGVHCVPQIWTAGDSYSQESHHVPAPYYHATHTPGDLQTKQHEEGSRAVVVNRLTEENTQLKRELEQLKRRGVGIQVTQHYTTHRHQNNGVPLDLNTLTCLKYCRQGQEIQRIHIINDMAASWERVGRMLKFREPDISNIRATCYGDPIKCCEALLSHWLDGYNNDRDSRPKNWDTLVEMIEDVRLGELANSIKQSLPYARF